jgi:hypothetical protein
MSYFNRGSAELIIPENQFLGALVQNIFTTPEGRARRQERKDMKVEGKYAEQMGLAQALSGGGAKEGSDNTILYLGIGFILLLVIGVVLFMVLKKK